MAPEPSPSERAATAAAKFTSNQTEVPLTNVSASMKTQPALTPAVMQLAANQASQSVSAQGSSGCTGSRFTGEPISVNLKDVDLRDFFRLIHEISGLNVILDPKITGTLTLVLDDVPWDQALYIVMKNNSLDCQLEGNVLRIAATATLKKEADDRRAQIEAQALAVDPVTITRYLSYAVAKDIVPTIKSFLSARGTIMADERSNSLVISDIPNVMPQVDRLIRELDKKTQEVEIEARVVAATRQFARDIGTQIGFRWGNASTSVGGAQSGAPQTVPNFPGPIPFFTSLGAGATTNTGIAIRNVGTNYGLDFILTAAESRGLIKILSRPRIVTQNNIQAVVRQGQRIPVVTGAQLGGPPTVTYIDAFLRLTVKPQITAENTIFLNVDVENTVPDFSRVTASQLNPVLITQQATTQVLVSDGGTVVIGGVIQTQTNVAINQTPLLGSIPVLGNLFKRRSVSTNTQELIFFLTPKIIQT
jgi:type IV pilus assembly protein PilQ